MNYELKNLIPESPETIIKVVNPAVRVKEDIGYIRTLHDIDATARLCYSSPHGETPAEQEVFIEKQLLNREHQTPLEDSKIKVLIRCSRVASHQFVRYRMSSPMQESSRYVKQAQIIVPPEIEKDQVEEFVKDSIEGFRKYYKWIKMGHKREAARYLIPHSCATTLQIVANIREWRHILSQRICKDVQPETRMIANMILDNLEKVYPVFFRTLRNEVMIDGYNRKIKNALKYKGADEIMKVMQGVLGQLKGE